MDNKPKPFLSNKNPLGADQKDWRELFIKLFITTILVFLDTYLFFIYFGLHA